jgi:hypothetical protein
MKINTLNLKTSPSHLLIFLLAALLLQSCGKGSDVKVVSKNFGEEINLQQNLIFTFSHDLVADSLLNDWDSTEYIRFEPAVRGKFKWTAPDELTFSPDFGFQPSTDYQATLTSELFKNAGKEKLSLTDKNITFHTPYLSIEKVTAYWTKSSSGSPQVRYVLAFNYKVNPTEVANQTTLTTNGQAMTVRPVGNNLSDKVELTAEASQDLENQVTEISIKEGVKTESGKTSPKAIQLSAQIPSRAPLQITDIYTEYEGETGVCYVHTNQTVASQNLNELISIDPVTDFTVEKHDYGFTIKSNAFQEGTYSLTFSNQMRGIFGDKLAEDYSQAVAFGEQKPMIAFASERGFYLSNKGSKDIGVKIIGLQKVKVTLYKVYENNIMAFTRNGGYVDDYSFENTNYNDYREENEYYDNNSSSTFGDVIYSKEVFVKDLRKEAGIYYLNMGFRDINQFKGMYALKVSSTDESYVNATKTLSVSDIGLLVKATDNEIEVFANSIISAEPLSGVTVSLVSSNNQSVYTAETDSKGVAKFSNIKEKAPKFKIAMVSAKTKDDFNFMIFNENRVETSRYEVGGIRENVSGYQAFLYNDRDIYRPGETMYLNTVIRDAKWKTVGEIPVKVKIIAPNGKEFSTLKGNLNKQSAFATQVTFPVSGVTGTYSVEVYSANDVLLTSKSISVEEFMPDRIKTDVQLSKTTFRTGETISMTATATNLFGPPASNRNYEVTFQVGLDRFAAKDFPEYNFDVFAGREVSAMSEVRQGTTDSEGKLKESLKIPDNLQDVGILSGKVFTTVFDESGRPVNRVNTFAIVTQDIFYGIRSFDSYVSTNAKLDVPIMAVNKDGKAVSGTSARVQVIKTNYETIIRRSSYGNLEYVSQKKTFVLDDKTIPVNTTGTIYSFIPKVSGEYEIRVGRPGSISYVSQSFYAYGYGTAGNSFEVNKDGQIIIETDKPKYQVGEKAKVLFKTPFAGKVLVTVERNKVYEQFVVETDKKSASADITIKEEYLPNAYITATLIKPMSDGAIPLTVAHGFAPVTVEDESYKLPVEIKAVASTRSKTKQTITVKSKPNTELTLAVVDEGILQLKNYKTPNPYDYFFQKRALEVNSYDIYPRLFPEMSAKSSSGGDGYALEKRVNPMNNRRVQLVSFWSGTLTTNGSGEATYTIDVPQFSGDLRIMAVAYKDNAFGSGSANMKVADPVVIASALPRFVSPGDKVEMPVTLSNTTKQATQATVQLKLTGGLSPAGGISQTVTIPANTEKQVTFGINAAQTVGLGSVEVVVNALGSTFTDKTELTIRPIQSLLKKSGAGTISGNGKASFTLAGNFIPASTQAKLVVSKSPVAEFGSNLNYLLEYPYGCVEQTTSTAFPQIYFTELSNSLHKTKKSNFTLVSNPAKKDNLAAYNVQQAINKLSSMQLGNGSLSYWPSGGQESWWGTAYAAHFMIEARRAGFEVNRQVLNNMLDYLRTQARNKKNLEEYFYYDENNVRRTKKIAPKEIAYSLYVLALGSKADVSTMNYYKSRKELLAIDSKYLLGTAYLLMGDNGSYRSLLPNAFAGEKSEPAFGGSFYSFVRDEAIALNALLDTDPQNVQVPVMAKHLSDAMKRNQWFSTQETAFALLAFGKIAKKTANSNITATILANGQNVATYKGEDLTLNTGIANKNISITTTGNGNLYYFWQAEGLTTSNLVEESDNFLKVRKSFYDRNGRKLSGTTFYQNDLVVVKLELATTDGNNVENVVITDMLPAGFEIENPRIAELPNMTWATANASYPDYLDIRDDRINLFATASGQVKTFYYVVRAVSTGEFRMGPVSADAMYNGDYHSLNGSGTIRVLSRKSNEIIEAEEVKADSLGK